MNDGIYYYISGCAGNGGLDLGFKETGKFKTACYIEREPYPQAVLIENMQKGLLDIAPIWSDFKTFDGRPWCGKVHGFIAGIPCQPHSMAGKRNGAEDDRNLWPDMQRIIREVEPGFVLVENVPGLFIGQQAYGLQIMGELQHMGYCVVSFTLSAREVGARHLRNRRFILGVRIMADNNNRYINEKEEICSRRNTFESCSSNLADSKLCRHFHKQSEKQSTEGRLKAQPDSESGCPDISNTECNRCDQVCNKREYSEVQESCSNGKAWGISKEYWKTEPKVGRVVDGVPYWVDRIKGLGNAVVPQVAYQVAQKILKILE